MTMRPRDTRARQPEERPNCQMGGCTDGYAAKCWGCGFDEIERRRRKALLRQEGLTPLRQSDRPGEPLWLRGLKIRRTQK